MKKKQVATKLICSLFFAIELLLGDISDASETFPVYPCIEQNVRFWVNVYTEFPTTKGILHDSNDLSIIYGVIDLWPPEKHGARKVNKKRIAIAREKYKKILDRLTQDTAAYDPEAARIAAMFGPNPDRVTFRKAMRNIRCQIGQKDRFQEGLIRSEAYIDEIKAIFRSRGLPEDLAYLPHVESSFNEEAWSKVGAAGIWQFTRATGRRFMTVGRARDERRDPIRSSEAAAQLLEENYEKLGSWPMAITAYNHGISGLLKARRAKGSYEGIFSDYSSRRFQFASRNFYSEFLAARHVANNSERYFGAIEVESSLGTGEVSMKDLAPIPDFSQYCEVDIETFRMLTTALRRATLNQLE